MSGVASSPVPYSPNSSFLSHASGSPATPFSPRDMVHTAKSPRASQDVSKGPAWNSECVVQKSRTEIAGIYGVGLKMDVAPPQPFVVTRVADLQDSEGKSQNHRVSIGDVLQYVDDRATLKDGTGIIEKRIFGSLDSSVKLTFRSKDNQQLYDLFVRRHVPIRTWEVQNAWYDVKPELRGKNLLTDASIVSALDRARASLVGGDGCPLDFLGDSKDGSSSVGLVCTHGNPDARQSEWWARGANTDAVPAVVEQVVAGSPAATAKVAKGDVVVSVDGVPADSQNVGVLLGGLNRIGTHCIVTISRSNKKYQISVPRTSAKAQARTGELLAFIAEDSDLKAAPTTQALLTKKVLELEKERQFEEQAVAAKIKIIQENVLGGIAQAVQTLHPQPDPEPDHELLAELDSLRRKNALLQEELQRTQEENRGLADKCAEAQRAAAAAAAAQKESDEARARMQELVSAADEQNRELRSKLAALADRMKNMVDMSELDLLRSQMAGMVKKHELDAALAREQSLKEELEALKAKLRGMVPAGDRDASMAEARRAQEDLRKALDELERLRAQLTSKTIELGEATEKVKKLQSDLDELRRLLEKMVPRSELEAAQGAIKKLQQQLDGSVSRDEYEEIEKKRRALAEKVRDYDQLKEQIELLKGQLAASGPKTEIDRLQKLLNEANAKITALTKEKEELKEELEALKKKMKEMVPKSELDALKEKLDALKDKLDKALAAAEAHKRDSQGNSEATGALEKLLAKLMKELDRAGLSNDQVRQKLFGVLEGPPALDGAEVVRLLSAVKECPGTGSNKVSEVADLIEKLAKDPTIGLDELTELVGVMQEGKPSRSAKEVKQAVEILNEEAPWTVEFLGKVKQALKDQGLDDISKLVICPAPPEHQELQCLKDEMKKLKEELERLKEELERAKEELERVKEELQAAKDEAVRLKEPFFGPRGGPFKGSVEVAIEGPPGSTVLVNMGPEPSEPTEEECMHAGESPFSVTVAEGCVVSARLAAPGQPLGPVRTEEYIKKREAPVQQAPVARSAPDVGLVGVGMLLEKDHGDSSQIRVKDIIMGGPVHKDGRIQIGHHLLKVDGMDVTGQAVQAIAPHVAGKEGTKVYMVLLGDDGEYAVELERHRAGGKPLSQYKKLEAQTQPPPPQAQPPAPINNQAPPAQAPPAQAPPPQARMPPPQTRAPAPQLARSAAPPPQTRAAPPPPPPPSNMSAGGQGAPPSTGPPKFVRAPQSPRGTTPRGSTARGNDGRLYSSTNSLGARGNDGQLYSSTNSLGPEVNAPGIYWEEGGDNSVLIAM